MIKCGSCSQRHETVAQVKACSTKKTTGGVTTMIKTATPTSQAPLITDKQSKFALDLAAQRDTSKLVFGGSTLAEVTANAELVALSKPPRYEVTRLAASHLIDELLSCPRLADTKTSGSSSSAWKSAVPKGRYAVELDGKLRFFFVRRTKSGFLKIREQAGPASYEKKFFEYKKIVDAILAAGIESSGKLYGRTLGHCYMCGLELTDETSRALGIGPVCRDK